MTTSGLVHLGWCLPIFQRNLLPLFASTSEILGTINQTTRCHKLEDCSQPYHWVSCCHHIGPVGALFCDVFAEGSMKSFNMLDTQLQCH